jgi:hypothetical protein
VASEAAHTLGQSLGLGQEAFTYLSSHGSLDVGHTQFFASLVNRLEEPSDRMDVVHCAKVFYRLYSDVFRHLDQRRSAPAAERRAA